MEYMVIQDIESVMEINDYTMEEMAKELGVSRITISNWLNNKYKISEKHIDDFYRYVFKKKIRLNKIKEQFYHEDILKENEKLLFHGAKTKIEGKLSFNHSKVNNDFGKGFYCGESLEQSAMFVSTYKDSSLYILKFKPENLRCKKFNVDTEWMLTIAYYRGKLNDYCDTKMVKKLAESLNEIDYVIAPIADNRMFEIIDSFIEGEITNIQCQHCLSATNLGMQYVFTSKKALSKITLLERCYLADAEKEEYLKISHENFDININKVKLAKKQYRNQGKYIEDIIK